MRGLFIGIGGTGDAILTQLKGKVYATYGEIPDTLQFRLIDTEAEEYRRNFSDELMGEDTISAITNTEYLQLKDDPPGTLYETAARVAGLKGMGNDFYRWFRADLFIKYLNQADFNLVRGAGQHRQFARMGVFLNIQLIQTLLNRAMIDCGSQGEGELPIFIIGSIAGGTGAGLFTDIALLSHWVAGHNRISKRIIGVAVLPEVFDGLGIDPTRAYATMREIMRFQAAVDPDYLDDSSEIPRLFSVQYNPNVTVDLNSKLFENLLFYNKKCTSDDARKSYFSQIADGLNLLLDEALGNQFFSQWINNEEGLAASFNSYRVFIPARLYCRQFILETEAAFANKLLPQDKNYALEFGSKDKRKEEAADILTNEISLFKELFKLHTDEEINNFSKSMTSESIVRTILGFGNPGGRFLDDVDYDTVKASERLYANPFLEIDTIDKKRGGDFEESKRNFSEDINRIRSRYKGDSEAGFSRAMGKIQKVIENDLKKRIDLTIIKYLESVKPGEMTIGKAQKVIRLVQDHLTDTIDSNINKITKNDGAQFEQLREKEQKASEEMKGLARRRFGWKGQLAERQKDYLDAVAKVIHWEQRMNLCRFLKDLANSTEKQLYVWIDVLDEWKNTLKDIIKKSEDENEQIKQRLIQQSRLDSASMGFTNTDASDKSPNSDDMKGYKQHLKDKCLIDPNENKPFIEVLFSGLRWGADPDSKTGMKLFTSKWPKAQDGLNAKEFREALVEMVSARINERMDEFEGMANYLEWLRDIDGATAEDLVDKNLKKVTENFISTSTTNHIRGFLLYGDTWKGKSDPNEFESVVKIFSRETKFTKGLQDNLTDENGVQLFKDKNVLAALMSDAEIQYDKISIIENILDKYIKTRSTPKPKWRTNTVHTFRCEQEAWRIERFYVLDEKDGESDIPLIPGEFTRYLDEPDKVLLFCKALVVKTIYRVEDPMGGARWECGSSDTTKPEIHLTHTANDKTANLQRALATFVLNQKDIRRNKTLTIQPETVNAWITDQVVNSGKNMQALVKEFKDNNSDLFDRSPYDLASPDEDIRFKAFLSLVLNYYLRDFLG